jgi:hypothetical protein
MTQYAQQEDRVNLHSTTPSHLRIDRQEFDRRIALRREQDAASAGAKASSAPAGPTRPTVAVQHQAKESLASALATAGQAPPEHAAALLRVELASMPDLPFLEQTERVPYARTPERQAQIEQTRMWAGCGLLPPHIRKLLPTSIAAVVSRIVDIVRNSGRGLCDWSVKRIAESVGVCRRTVQRALAIIGTGKLLGIEIERPINRGPELTDTNVVTIADTKPGKRLQKWMLRNQWGGRLFSHPKEIVGILQEAILPDTDSRSPVNCPTGPP